MLGLLSCGLSLAGCASKKPFNPVMGEDIIPTTGVQTFTTPARDGAWYSDRFIKEIFNDCLER